MIQEGRIKITIIPDIESRNYGIGVGYEVIEHIPPEDMKEISATMIRAKMRKDVKLYKTHCKNSFMKMIIVTIDTVIISETHNGFLGSWVS